MKKLAIVEKAYDISYELVKNGIAKANFSLLLFDDKNKYCKPFNYIKLYDCGEYVDTFRILPSVTVRNESTKSIKYDCEQVLGTLLDSLIFQYFEIGGVETNTETILKFILSKQNKWVLGKCDFNKQLQYSWENENLLSALWSVPITFEEDYIFTWDTTVFPFVLNLLKPNNKVKSYIRYNRNMKGITKTEDGATVCTRLYALGYGEGINQLNIKNVNPTKKPYVEAEKLIIDKYGIVEKIWADRRYIVEENLYNAAIAKLEQLKQPQISYEIEATELYALTNLEIDKFNIGDVVRVIDKETDSDFKTFIIRKSKQNIDKDYVLASLVLSNEPANFISAISDLSKRSQINETYSQGATNITTYNFSDNCDSNFPAILSFVIPNEAVRINKVLLSFKSESFRAYSKSVASSSKQTPSTSTQETQSQSTTVEAQKTPTTTTTKEETQTTDSGGKIKTTSSSVTLEAYNVKDMSDGGYGGANHNHGISSESQLITSVDFENKKITSVGFAPSGAHNHDEHFHSLELDSHKHSVTISGHNHSITVPSHSHSVTIPSHEHTVTIPEHTHQIQYGIYEGPKANKFTVIIDGKTVPINSAVNMIDIVTYLNKNEEGKINRGRHEIHICPNDLCRISADVVIQFFVNSQGGGSF